MSANHDIAPSLDEVLGAIAAKPKPPGPEDLRNWTTRFPQFKAEIIDFVTDWVEMEAASVPHEVTQEDVGTVVNRTMSRLQQVLDEAERQVVITDLSAEIKAAGYELDAFQRAIGVDRSILSCLVARLIRPATVPLALVRAVAEKLARDMQAVRAYLRLPPQTSIAYKSRRKPDPKPVDFAVIVASAELSKADRARWLAEAPDPELQD